MADELIEFVRKYEALYNIRCKEYKDQTIRTAVWEEIAAKLKLPVNQCRANWTKLRNAYAAALKRRHCKRSSPAAAEIPPWKYEEQMCFLRPYMEIRTKRTTAEQPSPLSPESLPSPDLSESPAPASPVYSASASHRRRSFRSHSIELQDNYTMLKSSNDLTLQKWKTKTEVDETDYFLLSMSKSLKALPKLDQIKIKFELHRAIHDAEMRQIQQKEASAAALSSNFDMEHQSKSSASFQTPAATRRRRVAKSPSEDSQHSPFTSPTSFFTSIAAALNSEDIKKETY